MSTYQSVSPQLSDPNFQMVISRMARYMKFLGILLIVYGALECIGCITALFGVPMIFMGIRMRESANAFTRYAMTSAPFDIYQAIERQKGYLFMQLLIIIGSLVFSLFYIVFVIIMVASGGFDN